MSADTWLLTLQGHEFHLLGGPCQRANVFDLEEVAHALALINRFNGHTSRPYSVAEHSLLVADIARADGACARQQLAALFHDAHEAFVGDLPSPAKWAVGQPWMDFEAHVAQVVRKGFGLAGTFAQSREAVRGWDLIALATERRDLTMWEPERHAPWAVLDTPGRLVVPFDDVSLTHASRALANWSEWRDAFVARARELSQAVKLAARADADADGHSPCGQGGAA